MAADGRTAPRPVCANHLDRDSSDQCTFCSRPICAECTLIANGDSICQHCLDRIKSRPAEVSGQKSDRPRRTLLWGLGLPVALGALYLLWRFLVP